MHIETDTNKSETSNLRISNSDEQSLEHRLLVINGKLAHAKYDNSIVHQL